MSIEDAIKRAMAGDFDPEPETPLADEAFAVLKSDLPYSQKIQRVKELTKQAKAAGGEDYRRFSSVVECMYADASAEEFALLQSDDNEWPA